MSSASPQTSGDQDECSGAQTKARSWRLSADAIGLGTIRQVVDEFYARVGLDPVLGPRFAVVEDWNEHRARIAHFWWVALGGKPYVAYRYRVVHTHRVLGVQDAEVEHWLALFADCVRSALPEPLAEAWLHRARAMGGSLSQAVGKPRDVPGKRAG